MDLYTEGCEAYDQESVFQKWIGFTRNYHGLIIYMKYSLFFFISIVCIISALLWRWDIWFVYPSAAVYPIRGIDVSHYQGEIDWKWVKNSGINFVYLKMTEGDDWVDKNFEKHYQTLKSISFPVWAYHFFSLRQSGESQFAHIQRTISWHTLDLPFVIDLEYVGNSVIHPEKEIFAKELHDFLVKLEVLTHRKPILYTTYEFRNDYLTWFELYPLWIRDIFGYPKVDFLIWQYKDRAHIDGIVWSVDLNAVTSTGMNFLLWK